MSKKFWVLAGILSSIGFVACDDSSSDDSCDPANFPFCFDGAHYTCVDHKLKVGACGEGFVCDNLRGCIAPSGGGGCENDARSCQNGVPAVCENNMWIQGETCGSDEKCVAGKCEKSYIECTPACDEKTQVCDTTTGKCRDLDEQFTVEKVETLKISDASKTCERSGNGGTLVFRGDVLTKDKVYLGGSVVVSNGKITKVGKITEDDMAGATVITCPNAVISAGLLNGHDHVTYNNQYPDSWADERFDHRHDWRKSKNGHSGHNARSTGKVEVTELRQLLSGTVGVFGSGSYNGLIRNLDRSGAYGSHKYPQYETFPLDDGNGTTIKSGCSYKGFKLSKYAFGPHIGEGINEEALNELRCLSGEGSNAKDIFNSKLAIIHGVAATASIIQKMAKNNSKLIWSPRSNISLYGDTAQIPVFKNMGVTIALGTDWVPSGSVNMLREMQCADFLNEYYFNKVLTDYDIWMAATYNVALALGYEDITGDLKPGNVADIAIFKKSGNEAHRAVIDAQMKDVTAVVIDGKLVYGDANIMQDSGAETLEVCGVSKKINTKATGTSEGYKAIASREAYETFYCDKPKKEPTCIPMRPRAEDTTSQSTTKYGEESYKTGSYYSDPNDIDGDGIPNAQDNCPNVFNPIRPIDVSRKTDSGKQADADGDGIGDACDLYPLCAANDATCK